jgi:hypothetical protein
MQPSRIRLTAIAFIFLMACAACCSSLAQDAPSIDPDPTSISETLVWIYCAECGPLPHILWQSPDEIGTDRPFVNEGDQCLLQDQQTSAAGIEKVQLLCGTAQGWLSAEGISLTPP